MRLLTAPTAEPVTLDQVKFAARLTGSTAFDAMLPVYMQAAREIAESQTGVRWMNQQWRIERYNWPSPCEVLEVNGPTAVTVSYWSASNAWTEMTSGTYVWADADPGLVIGALVWINRRRARAIKDWVARHGDLKRRLADVEALRREPVNLAEHPDHAAIRYLEELRLGEGDSVTILCDDPEAESTAKRMAIVCNGAWTQWQD